MMWFLPTATVAFPLLGAGVVLAMSLANRLRFIVRLVALAIAGLTVVLVLDALRTGPLPVLLSSWQPVDVFGASLAMQVDPAIQPLALALSVCTFSAFLVAASRTEESHSLSAALSTGSSLTMLAAGLLALFSANPLTMIVGWAIYDLAEAGGHILAGESSEVGTRSLIFGTLALVCVWSGAVLSPRGVGHTLWSRVTISNAQSTLWAIAGIIRLRVYPLHLATPTDHDTAKPLSLPLFVGPVLGWGLWLRLTQANAGFIGEHPWVPAMAAIAFVVGGFLAWSCRSASSSLSWSGIATSGGVLLAAGIAPDSASTVIAAGGVAWLLGNTLLLLREGYHREALWSSIPSLIGMLTVLGLPLTPGFVAGATLAGRLTEVSPGWWGSAFYVGNVLLISALIRVVLTSPSPPEHVTSQGWFTKVRRVWLFLLALLLVVASLLPSTLFHSNLAPQLGPVFAIPALSGWLLWTTSVATGATVAWLDASLRRKIGLFLYATHDLLRLDWVYDLLNGALRRGLRIIQAADEIVGGAGAVLWSLLLFLLIVLLWGNW